MSDPNSNELLTKKELYERYWKCRDFELKTLWQRAAFLGPLLALTFTGYGCFFVKCFISEDGLLRFLDYPDIVFSHFVAIVIALMGAVFSMLWIYMMKGSKAWYEVYERAITAMDTQKDWLLPTEFLDCCGGFKFQRLPGYLDIANTKKDSAFDDKLFSMNGGVFSPSKINIAIGQVSLAFWFVIIVLHSVLYFVFWIYKKAALEGFHICNSTFIAFCIFALVIIGIIVGVFAQNCGLDTLEKRCKSSSLSAKDPNRSENPLKVAVQISYSRELTDEMLKELLPEYHFEQCADGYDLYRIFEVDSCEAHVRLLDTSGEKSLRDEIPNYAFLNEDEWIVKNCSVVESNFEFSKARKMFFEQRVKPTIKELLDLLKKRR